MARNIPARGRLVILVGAAAIASVVLAGCDTTFAYVYPDRGQLGCRDQSRHGYLGHDDRWSSGYRGDRYHGQYGQYGHYSRPRPDWRGGCRY